MNPITKKLCYTVVTAFVVLFAVYWFGSNATVEEKTDFKVGTDSQSQKNAETNSSKSAVFSNGVVLLIVTFFTLCWYFRRNLNDLYIKYMHQNGTKFSSYRSSKANNGVNTNGNNGGTDETDFRPRHRQIQNVQRPIRRPSLSPIQSVPKSYSFTTLLNQTVDANRSFGYMPNGQSPRIVSPVGVGYPGPKNKMNPFSRSPYFAGPVIFPISSPMESTPINSPYSLAPVNLSPKSHDHRLQLNRESTRNMGSPTTRKLTPSNLPSGAIRPPPLPVAHESEEQRRQREGVVASLQAMVEKRKRRCSNMSQDPLSPTSEQDLQPSKKMRQMPTQTPMEVGFTDLKRPPLRDIPVIPEIQVKRPRARGINSVTASLTSSKRARERETSPMERTPKKNRSRRNYEEGSVKSPESSTPKRAVPTKRPSTESLKSPPEKRDKASTEVRKSSDDHVTPASKKGRKGSEDKTQSPTVTASPDWMKDKQSDEYKAEVARQLKNMERDKQLAEERLEAMLKAIDGEETEKSRTPTPTIQAATTPVTSTLMSLLKTPSTPQMTGPTKPPEVTLTTSVISTTPTAGIQPSLANGITAQKDVPNVTKTAESPKMTFRPAFGAPASSPAAATPTPAPSTPTTSSTSQPSTVPSFSIKTEAPPSTKPSPAVTLFPVASAQDQKKAAPTAALFPQTSDVKPTITPQKPGGFSFGLQPQQSATQTSAGATPRPAPATTPSIASLKQEQRTTTVLSGTDTKSGFSFPAGAPSSTQTSGFNFKVEAPSTASVLNLSTAPKAPNAASSGFGFATSQTAASTTSGFGFAAAPSTAAAAPNTAAAAPSTAAGMSSGFGFATTQNTAPSTSSGFGFAAAPSTAPNSTSGFSFSATPATSQPASVASVLGLNLTAASTRTATPSTGTGFSFAGSAPSTTASAGFSFNTTASAPTTTNSNIFSFTSTSKPAATTSASAFSFTASTQAPTPAPSAFNFSAQPPQTTAANFSFNAAPKSSSATSSGFSFNTAAAGSKPAQTSTAPSFSFASTAPAKTTASSSVFQFGNTQATATQGTASGSVFGGSTTGGFSFGGTSTSTPSVFGGSTPSAATPAFGASTSAPAPAFGSSGTPASAFGSSTTPAAPSFGGSSTPAPAFGGSSTAPAFGRTGTPAAPAFGSTTPAAPAFGGSATPAPSFGSSTSTAFGQANQTAGTNVFGSGGSAFSATSPPAFGGQSTPAVPAFGQPSAPAGFGGQPAAAPSFGSPAPAPAAGPAGAVMFSMGSGSAAPKPRSTIKARRRTTHRK